MKQIIFMVVLSLVIIGCDDTEKVSISMDSLALEEVIARIENLRKFIIPSYGTNKVDVDAIFGVSEVITEFTKGSASNYPMNIYQLLTPEPKQEFKAVLYVTYKENKVTFIGINHVCVTKGRVTYPQDSPEQIKQQQEIERENVQVLKDLIEIESKYKRKLEKASWNK